MELYHPVRQNKTMVYITGVSDLAFELYVLMLLV